MKWIIPLALMLMGLALAAPLRADDGAAAAPAPKIAIFPIGGDAVQRERDRLSFSMRSKLERGDAYDVIDGPRMKDVAAEASGPITFDTSADDIKTLAKDVDAVVMVWGEYKADGSVRLKVLDLRQPNAKPRELDKSIDSPEQMRFVVESVLETLKGVGRFDHPNETAIADDARASYFA